MPMPATKQPLNSFGIWIATTLADLDLQQKDLANLLGTTESYLSFLARGNKAPKTLLTRWKKRCEDVLREYQNPEVTQNDP